MQRTQYVLFSFTLVSVAIALTVSFISHKATTSPVLAQETSLPNCNDVQAIKDWARENPRASPKLSDMFGISNVFGYGYNFPYQNFDRTEYANPWLNWPEDRDEERWQFVEEIARTYAQAGVVSGRTWFSWPALQPESSGQYQWFVFDKPYELVDKYFTNSIVTIGGTPDWISTAPTEAENPRLYPANDLEPYKTMLGKLVSRYGSSGKNQIHHWEIWNEVNGKSFVPAPGTTRAESYQPMLEAAYKSIKKTDPQAKVLFSGIVAWRDLREAYEGEDNFLTQELELNRVNPSFDIFNFHTYGTSDLMLQFACKARVLLSRYDIDTPIWITETGSYVNQYKLEYSIENIKEKYDSESLETLRSFGVEKLFWWSDWYKSLLDRGGSPNEAYFTYQEMSRRAREADGLCVLESDLNCDRKVDILDLLAWRRLWVQGDIQADLDGNGQINILDYLFLLRGWLRKSQTYP